MKNKKPKTKRKSKIDRLDALTAILVVLACVLTGLFMPTEIGVNVKVEGAPSSEVVAPSPEVTAPPVTETPTAPPSTDSEEEATEPTEKEESAIPQGNQEIIEQYTLLVDKFKKERPAYKRKEFQALPEEHRNFGKGINVILSVASGYMTTEEDAEEIVRAKGAEEILYDMPIHGSEKGCVLTDYDSVAWAKCEDLGDGTYKISFSLKEEKNPEPTPADTLIPVSNHGAVMQPMKFSELKAEVDKIAGGVPGVTINQFELQYRDGVYGCVYKPETNEVLSITHNIVIDIVADATVFGASVAGTARLLNDMLIYDITW